jgi:hypothetical protein
MYKRDKNILNSYILELWGGSTKHPDSVFYMEDYEMAKWVDKDDAEMVDGQIFQWLLECASKLNYPPCTKELVNYALENFYFWEI